jgi:hypothetical protein
MEFFLRKLPKDVSEALLTQQSKGRLNTVCYPLCLAIRLSLIFIRAYSHYTLQSS